MAGNPVKYFVVDAFTDSAFKGNPAAVCFLEKERDDCWLQSVAAEFNVSETCYLIRTTDFSAANPRFHLRWFTPVTEVKLCGHATLAASHALFSSEIYGDNIIEFHTLSGVLTAKKVVQTKKDDDPKPSYLIELDFPTVPITEFNPSIDDLSCISRALNGASIIEIRRTTTDDDIFVVLPSGEAVRELQPQFEDILKCPGRGIIVTGVAPAGSGFDFYSRYFCPKNGINEDPVTGSVHCSLATYWSKKLGKCDFLAFAASPRSGILDIHLDEEKQRVLLRGKAVTVMQGSLLV